MPAYFGYFGRESFQACIKLSLMSQKDFLIVSHHTQMALFFYCSMQTSSNAIPVRLSVTQMNIRKWIGKCTCK